MKIEITQEDLEFIQACLRFSQEIKEELNLYQYGSRMYEELMYRRNIHNEIGMERLEEILERNNIEIEV